MTERSAQQARRRKSRYARRRTMGRALLFAAALMLALMFLLPTVLTITNSFMRQSEITANYGVVFGTGATVTDSFGNTRTATTYMSQRVNLKFIPDQVSLEQYTTVLIKTPEYLLKFWNSVMLVVPIVIFQVLLASFAAYSFARYRGRLKELIFFGYVFLMLMPYQVTLVPNYLVTKWLGLLDTRWAVILPGIFAPFSVFLLTKNMRRIPTSYIEAARLDGAGEWQIFTKVCLPMCKGVLYSVAILVFIDYWNMVEQPMILFSDEEMYPLSVFLNNINSGEVGIAFAAAVIYMIPTLLLFLHGEEYLEEGITYSGGIKG
jgi:multiple sugar transport system permease protein